MEVQSIMYVNWFGTESSTDSLQCALEHNIPIVRPSWIEENYEIWLRGDDVDTDLERVSSL